MKHSPPAPRAGGKPVVVVGGGVSGLAAAVELSSRGIPVTVLEQKPVPGGRAYSFVDAKTDEVIDNGQHVLLAGYERTMRFLATIGSRHLLAVQHRPLLVLHHPRKGFRQFHLPALPTPFHLIFGVLGSNLFSLRDRVSVLRGGLAIARAQNSALAGKTVMQWLDDNGQSEEVRLSFWEPLAVSIMNTHIAFASAQSFVGALRKAFLGGRRNASLAIPRVGLSQLYVDGARKTIVDHGGTVECNREVVGLDIRNGIVERVRLKSGKAAHCDAVIVAVPPHALGRILPDDLLKDPVFAGAGEITYSPIVSLHLWFDEDFMSHESVGVIGRRIQWAFNRRRLMRDAAPGGHISVVISGAHELVGLSNDDLVKIALEDLRTVYPMCPAAVRHSVVIREKRATIALSPEVEKLRPSQKTSVPNLFLAGDWTDTGYPATIEGAIVSAEKCCALFSAWHQRVRE